MVAPSRREDGMIDVIQAAGLAGRHPETIRRWIWSGRLGARRRGRRLLVAEADVLALWAPMASETSLRDWAERARALRRARSTTRPGQSAADLIIEDRARRSSETAGRASR